MTSNLLPKVVWLLVDGLSLDLLTTFIKHHPQSILSGLARRNRVFPLQPLAPNCQTPPSLFTIWSGTLPAHHGLTGYDVPAQLGDDPSHYVDGFADWRRDISMVWDRYAAAGKTIRTCGVPFVQHERLGNALLSATDVFRPLLLQPSVAPIGGTIELPALDINLKSWTDGQGRAMCQCGTERYELHDGQTQVVQIAKALDAGVGVETHAAIAIHAATIDGVPSIVNLGFGPILVHGQDAARRRAAYTFSPYVFANPGKLYEAGLLGAQLRNGGDGQSERLLMDLMFEVHRCFSEDIQWAVASGDADLVVGYYPVVDLMSHQILASMTDLLDFTSGEMVKGLFNRAVRWLDALLETLSADIGPDTRFVVHSDHGMSPIMYDINLNCLLAEWGFLSVDANGTPNWQQSLVFLHPAENGLLVFHAARMRQAGLFVESIIAELSSVLARKGLPGLRIVDGPRANLSSEWIAHHFVQPPPHARLKSGLGAGLVCASKKGGDHTVCTDDPWLRGVCIDASTQAIGGLHGSAMALEQILPWVLTPSIGLN